MSVPPIGLLPLVFISFVGAERPIKVEPLHCTENRNRTVGLSTPDWLLESIVEPTYMHGARVPIPGHLSFSTKVHLAMNPSGP